jgi:hypothetical protein
MMTAPSLVRAEHFREVLTRGPVPLGLCCSSDPALALQSSRGVPLSSGCNLIHHGHYKLLGEMHV